MYTFFLGAAVSSRNFGIEANVCMQVHWQLKQELFKCYSFVQRARDYTEHYESKLEKNRVRAQRPVGASTQPIG